MIHIKDSSVSGFPIESLYGKRILIPLLFRIPNRRDLERD